MLRNLLGWLLLAPMLLNGLWVVCDDVPTKAGEVSHELSEAEADCARICALKLKNLDAGAMCFLLPGDSKTTVTVFDFGVAVVTPEVQLAPVTGADEFVTPLPVFYSNPSLTNHTPPPKA